MKLIRCILLGGALAMMTMTSGCRPAAERAWITGYRDLRAVDQGELTTTRLVQSLGEPDYRGRFGDVPRYHFFLEPARTFDEIRDECQSALEA